MDRARVYRCLRITFSAFCLIVCALLIALWVRTYTTEDGVTVYVPKHRIVSIASQHGVFDIFITLIPNYEVKAHVERGASEGYLARFSYWRFRLGTDDVGRPQVAVRFPHLFAILLAAAMATLPWIRWRFRLRTLLIATTLVAVLLGAIVWAVR